MHFIDTHTHLFSEKYEGQNSEVVKRALDSGIDKMVLPNIDLKSIQSMMDLSREYPKHCFPTMGLHPCDVKEDYKKVLSEMKKLFSENRFYAIGETGLDLYWDKSTLSIQKEALRIQIEWAKVYQLPIIIHARESYDELFEVFDEMNDDRLSGVFHCFTGNEEQAAKIIGYGNFWLGIGGVLTYKNSGLDETVRYLDLDHLVLETDSPYLSPAPHRGKTNESSYLHYIASKLAEVKEISIEEVSRVTTKNAQQLFNF